MDIEKQTRYDFIDFLKGIGIFLVVWGHTMMPRSVYIYSFHMPLFFFLSGFLHKNKPFGRFLISKLNTLYIPYALFTVLSWLFYLLRHLAYARYSEITPHLLKLSSIITGTAENGGNNPIWFLTCMFVISVVFWFIARIHNSAIAAGIIAWFSLVGYWLGVNDLSLYFNIDIAFTGIVFYYIGYIVRQHDLVRYLDRLKPVFLIGILVVAEALHIGAAYFNTRVAAISRVNMAGNLLGDFFLFYAAALLGVFVFVTIGYRIRSQQVFNYLGMNSLLILATHKPLLLILNTHIGRYLNIPDEVYGLAATLTVLLVSVPVIEFINRKIPQLIGKKPLVQWEIPLHYDKQNLAN